MKDSSLYHRFRAVLHLLLMQSVLPVTLTYMVVEGIRALLRSTMNRSSTKSLFDGSHQAKKVTVVLTGGKMSKTLHLCRCLRQYADATSTGIKIIVLEQRKFRWNATRFSRCVDVFVPITSPRESPSTYMRDIVNACVMHNATHFLPVAAPVEAVYDAQLKTILETQVGTKSLHMDHELCRILDDKHKFGCFVRDTLQINSLRTHLVSSDEEAHKFNDTFRQEAKTGKLKRTMILKNLAYDPIHRLDLFKLPCSSEQLDVYLRKIRKDGNPITSQEPWQLQEFLRDGVEYAAMIVVRNNHMVTLTCATSSASQLNYVHVEVSAIRQWVNDFMTSLQRQSEYTLTGQLCFDFMVLKEEGREVAYPIECNPRVHTQCTIYNSDEARALFGGLLMEESEEVSQRAKELLREELENDYPAISKTPKETYWFYNEFFKIFPNSWLLVYNDDRDILRRSKRLLQPLPRWTAAQMLVLLMYLPSILCSLILASPITLFLSLISFDSNGKPDNDVQLTRTEHAYAIILYACDFVQRRLTDSSNNIEADWWKRDPAPFLIKNHVQVIVRLLASLRTGVEWKKIDFAIGKVVEVGGD